MPVFGTFPGGMNNRASANAMPTDQQGNPLYARNINNLVPRNNGDFFSRPGVSLAMSTFDAKDGWGCPAGMFFRDGRTVKQFKIVDGSEQAVTVCQDVTGSRIAWMHCKADGKVYFSDGIKFMVWDGSVCQKVGIDAPSYPPRLSGANVLGNGTVSACYTYLTEDGRESGASYATTALNGRLVSGIKASLDSRVTNIAIYMTIPNAGNDEQNAVYYHAGVIANGTTSYDVSADYQHGKILKTFGMRPLPPASHICWHKGRAVVASGPYLHWSEPSDPWLYQAGAIDLDGVYRSSSIPLEDDVTMLAPVPDGGLYIGTDYGVHYIENLNGGSISKVSGNPPEFASVSFRLDTGNPVWYSKDGFVEGGAGGSLSILSNQAAVSMDTSGDGGAALTLMDLNGVSIAISVPKSPVRGRLQARDWGRLIDKTRSII